MKDFIFMYISCTTWPLPCSFSTFMCANMSTVYSLSQLQQIIVFPQSFQKWTYFPFEPPHSLTYFPQTLSSNVRLVKCVLVISIIFSRDVMNWWYLSPCARIKLMSFTVWSSCNKDLHKASWWIMQCAKITSDTGIYSFSLSWILFRIPTFLLLSLMIHLKWRLQIYTMVTSGSWWHHSIPYIQV